MIIKQSIPLTGAIGKDLTRVTEKATYFNLVIDKHEKILKFKDSEFDSHRLDLGTPMGLPSITLGLTERRSSSHLTGVHANLLRDEGMTPLGPSKKEAHPAPTDTSRSSLNQDARRKKKSDVLSRLPRQYHQWLHLFLKEAAEKAFA